MFPKTVMNNLKTSIKHLKQDNNTTRFIFSKDYSADSVENEFEMSSEWKQDIRLEGHYESPWAPWQDLDQGSGSERVRKWEVLEVEWTWVTPAVLNWLVGGKQL